MTSGLQPPFSGAPTPVQGVTGGPPVLGGQLGNDPTTGAIVISPNPGNAVQVRKGANPTAFQVYEYFNSNTSFARLALNSQSGGPFQIAVETNPGTVIRDLQISTNRNLIIVANEMIPNVDNAVLLGDATHTWASLYLHQLNIAGTEVTPVVDNTIQLGDPTHRFVLLYMSNQIFLGTVARGGTGNGSISYDPDGSFALQQTGLTATTAGAAPGVYLKVVIGGAPYKIQLLSV